MNKVFKRALALGLSAVLTAGCLAGCSADNGENKTAKTTYKIGICQLVQHAALDAATQGFMDKLTALGEEQGIAFEFDQQNASGEATNCTTITSNFVSNGVDLIMANATDALAAASQATADIPIVATSITDYATALGISDWTGKTGFNVTGSSDLAPLAEQANMFKELCPEAKNVAILYCSPAMLLNPPEFLLLQVKRVSAKSAEQQLFQSVITQSVRQQVRWHLIFL